MRVEWFVAGVVLASGLAAASAGESEGLAKLPVNHWVKLPCKAEPGYVWSALVYVPSRGQILHWGATANPAHSRDDVRAFDLATMDWVSDYPSAPASVLRKASEEGGKSVRVWGLWGMLPETGRPAPSWTVNAVTYDSKRKQLVFALRGMMAAYDPAARTWRDLKAETELKDNWSLNPSMPYGMYERGLRPEQDLHNLNHRMPGPPPVYGAGICYDPANDEILLFPHWGSQDSALRPFAGRVSGHSGTWVYSFKDNSWRRMTWATIEIFGGPRTGVEVDERSRREILLAMSDISQRMDEAYAAHRGFAEDATRLDERECMAGTFIIEPPPRCGAPMVYDPKAKAIVLFGGQSGLVRSDVANPGRAPEPGALDDTWLYDLPAREWRLGPCENRPPEQGQPKLVHDEASGLTLMVTLPGRYGDKGQIALWAFDAKCEWAKRHEEPWPWGGPAWASVAFDPKNRLLLLVRDGKDGQETFAFRLDLDKLPAQPAPAWKLPPPIERQKAPPDDPAWLAKLKELPPNTWVLAKPPREPERRDWGTLACDPVRGLVFYFGGGHSTYQVNDVAIYAVGANRWCHAVGDSNSPIPPHDWDGCTMSFQGGPPAGHQRNSYVALDGRMFVHAGTHSRRWDAEIAKEKGIRVAWFYDLDRGGVWRQREIEKIELGEGVPGSYGRLHVADPSGKIHGFAGHLEPYDGRFFSKEAYFSTYDVHDNSLAVRKIPEPTPGWVGECRPFCFVETRDSHLFSKGIFFYECRKDGGHATWAYDIAENRFIDLKPPHQPPAEPRTVEYIDSQQCVLAIIGQGEQWVYSFEKNDWAPLPLRVEGGTMGFQTPYGQMVWVAKYRVLVNVCGSTWLMRPEFSRP
jgi:hypothetical protein